MSNVLLEEKINGYLVRILHDDGADNPILEEEAIKIAVWCRNYDFGNCHDFEDPQEFTQFCKNNRVVKVPIFMLDHSGITINTTGFGCPWDSSQVGWAFLTESAIAEHGISNPMAQLKAAVDTLNDYLVGNCYGYEILKQCACCGSPIEVVDSCWGFFGEYDGDVLEEARTAVPETESLEAWGARMGQMMSGNPKQRSYAI